MICLDVSGSMLFEDMLPTRLEVAKKEIINFIKKRQSDRIGLIAFSGQAYLLCPLTLDHNLLIDLLKKLNIAMILYKELQSDWLRQELFFI